MRAAGAMLLRMKSAAQIGRAPHRNSGALRKKLLFWEQTPAQTHQIRASAIKSPAIIKLHITMLNLLLGIAIRLQAVGEIIGSLK